MTKAIILDLGNVIVPIDFGRCHDALAKVCSYPRHEIPARIRSTGLVEGFETGQVSPQDFVNEVSNILGMEVSYPEFWEIWSSIFAPETLLPESLLEGLGRRQRLLLLSNTNAI